MLVMVLRTDCPKIIQELDSGRFRHVSQSIRAINEHTFDRSSNDSGSFHCSKLVPYIALMRYIFQSCDSLVIFTAYFFIVRLHIGVLRCIIQCDALALKSAHKVKIQ